MRNNVEIEVPQGDLRITVWRFSYLTGYGSTGIVFDSLQIMNRPTKRHKFLVESKWSRLDTRGNTMTKPDVPLDIQMETMKQFRQSLKWREPE